jgi:hypothetical protein
MAVSLVLFLALKILQTLLARTKLEDLAAKAVGDAQGAPGMAVLVAAGTMAATALQNEAIGRDLADALPIVQAAGGATPANAQGNVTGFYLNAQQICKEQFDQLNSPSTTPVAVLFDSYNDPSVPLFNWLQGYGGKNVKGVDIKGDVKKITSTALKGNNGFMLIPNALFYKNASVIAKAVDQAKIQAAIYPEREYKKAHANRSRMRFRPLHSFP